MSLGSQVRAGVLVLVWAVWDRMDAIGRVFRRRR